MRRCTLQGAGARLQHQRAAGAAQRRTLTPSAAHRRASLSAQRADGVAVGETTSLLFCVMSAKGLLKSRSRVPRLVRVEDVY